MDTRIKTAHSTFRRFFTLAMLVAVGAALALPNAAYAKGGKGKAHAPAKVGLPSFSGPGEAASRGATEKALKSRKIVVVPNAELASAAKSLHVRLDNNDGFKAVSKSLGLTAIVVGEVTKKKATLTIHSGDDGSVAGEETFQGADPHKVAAAINKTFWKRLAGAFNKTKPPGGGSFEAPPPEEEPAGAAASEPEAAAEKSSDSGSKKTAEASEEKSKPEAESEPSEKKTSKSSTAKSADDSEPLPEGPNEALDIFAGPAILMRSLSFNQQRNDLSDTKTASYSLPAAPVLNFRGDFFPGALSGGTGLAANIGVTADVSYLLPVVTSPGQGGNYKTSSLSWSLGGKVRLPYGLFGTVSYGDEWFKLVRSSSNMALSVVPGTDYKFARIGAGIRTQVSSTLMLMANLDYVRCLSLGDIGATGYFPHATCAALEVGVGAGYKISPTFEIRGGVDLRRFGLAFNVKPSDVNSDPSMSPPVAGGAVDQYVQIYLGVAYLMGGSESSAASASSEPAETKSDTKKAAKSDDEGGDGKGDADAE